MWSPFKRLFKRGESGASTPPETVDVPPAGPVGSGASTLPEAVDVPTLEPDEISTATTPAAVDVSPADPEQGQETAGGFDAATGPTPPFVPIQNETPPIAMDPLSNEPLSETNDLTLETSDETVSAGETLHTDPITGEPGAHPAAVGVGALGAGAAGAAIGALAGPVGIVIGAAIGAIAGGLAGHEAAVTTDEREAEGAGALDADTTGEATDETGRPASLAGAPLGDPITMFPGSDFGAPTVLAGGMTAAAFDETSTAAIPESEPAVASGESEASGTDPVSTLKDEPGVAAIPVAAQPRGDIFGSDAAVGWPADHRDDPHEIVRKAAYYLYLDRLEAGRSGDALGDWYEAEREVTRF